MGTFSIWHWLLVLLIVILVFGTRKLTSIGKDLGSAVRGFKEGLHSDDDKTTIPAPLSDTTLEKALNKAPPKETVHPGSVSDKDPADKDLH